MNKPHKYNASITIIDGVRFGSKLEAIFYKYFKENNIKILELQPKFILQEKFKHDGKTIREISYIADFKIDYTGDVYYIDCKGFEPPVFKIKHKMWLKRFGQENILLVVKSIKQLESIII